MSDGVITEVSICNQALSWLATGRILDIDENTERGRLCHDNYYEARDATLESAAWTFATRREKLTPGASIPAYGYGTSFDVPTDVLRVIEARNDAVQANGVSNLDWRREGQSLVADADLLYIKSIIRIIDVTLFSTLFRQALAARLAAMMSPTITESNTKTETLWNLYGKYIQEAKATDGSQGKTDRIRGRSLIQQVR